MTEEDKGRSICTGNGKGLQTADDNTWKESSVKPIEAVGQEFDPNFHNAVMHVEDEESR